MRTAESLSRDEWEGILHAPFHAYMHVGGVEGPPIEAQFRFLTEEFAAGRDAFSDGSVGAMMTAALTENLDSLWAAFQATGQSSKDGLGSHHAANLADATGEPDDPIPDRLGFRVRYLAQGLARPGQPVFRRSTCGLKRRPQGIEVLGQRGRHHRSD